MPRLPVAERFAERRFAEPIGLIDDVLMTAHDLAIQLVAPARGRGAGGAELPPLPLPGRPQGDEPVGQRRARHPRRRPYRPAVRQPRRAAGGRIRCRLRHRHDPAGGRLRSSPLDGAQIGAFETRRRRRRSRPALRPDDQPAGAAGGGAVASSSTPTSPSGRSGSSRWWRAPPTIPRRAPDPTLPRPLRLLPAPEPISVIAEVPRRAAGRAWSGAASRYRFVKASGPERIGAEWWRPDYDLDCPPPPQIARTADLQPRRGSRAQPARLQRARARPQRATITSPRTMAAGASGCSASGSTARRAAPRWFLHGFFA